MDYFDPEFGDNDSYLINNLKKANQKTQKNILKTLYPHLSPKNSKTNNFDDTNDNLTSKYKF